MKTISLMMLALYTSFGLHANDFENEIADNHRDSDSLRDYLKTVRSHDIEEEEEI